MELSKNRVITGVCLSLFAPCVLIGLNSPAFGFTLVNGTDQMTGWAFDEVPVFLNPTDCTVSEAKLVDAIEGASVVWNAVTTSRLKLRYGGAVDTTYAEIAGGTEKDTQNGPVIICLANMSDALGSDSEYIPAATGTGFRSGTELAAAFMLLNAEEGKSAEISNIPDEKLSLIIAHELGHAVGIGHTADQAALMYFDATEKESLRLGREDIAAVTYIYPRNEILGDLPLGCGSIVSGSINGLWGAGSMGIFIGFARWVCSRKRNKQGEDK